MSQLAMLATLLVILLWCPAANTGESKDHGATGTTNWDYFTANGSPETKRLLNQVEQNHLDRSWGHAKGVPGFIADQRYDAAKLDLDYTLVRFPNHPKALLLLGVVAKLGKEPALPLKYYENALKLFPQYAVTHAQYGNYLVDIKQMESGIAKLRDAIQIDPNLVVGHVWLARAYYQMGNAELGRQAAEKARELGYKGEISTGPDDKR